MYFLEDRMSKPDQMKSQIAALESKVDLLESEITHLDEILRQCGFPHGISTLKSTVSELLDEVKADQDDDFGPFTTV